MPGADRPRVWVASLGRRSLSRQGSGGWAGSYRGEVKELFMKTVTLFYMSFLKINSMMQQNHIS